SATPAGAAQGDNALLAPSPLPFQAPPFDRIRDTDYQPAIEEGMRQHLAEIRAIADNPEPPSFANTIEAMERAGALLSRAMLVFEAMTSAHTNPTLQAAEEVLAPKLAEHSDAIHLDPALFARVKAVYDQRDSLGLDAEQKALVEHRYDAFVRAGALLSDADKAELRKLNAEESSLTTAFGAKLLAATNAGAGLLTDKARLEGLDEGTLAAAEAAKAAGKEGWLLVLQNTTQQPVLGKLEARAVREEILRASTTPAARGDDNDTR